MTTLNRQNVDRRRPDRRSADLVFYGNQERRDNMRRGYVDRRNDPVWQFSWLRVAVSQHLRG